MSGGTQAPNKCLFDELIDTSLHRGGAAGRQRQGYYEGGGTSGNQPATAPTTNAAGASQELIQAVNRVKNANKALPSWVRIHWDRTIQLR